MGKSKTKLKVLLIIAAIILAILLFYPIKYRPRPVKSYTKYKVDKVDKIEVFSHYTREYYQVIDKESFYKELSKIKVRPTHGKLKRTDPYDIKIYVGERTININSGWCNGHCVHNQAKITTLTRDYVLEKYNVDILEHPKATNQKDFHLEVYFLFVNILIIFSSFI